ncbi:MAG: SIMPL domain-containing protein [Bifidobacteriaceae bacterium]|jgi:uncharacterized protein YggE|nr:SIMPL domain-containing protein [Bifidobacteriaceae bacterium]
MQTSIVVTGEASGQRRPKKGYVHLRAGVTSGVDWHQTHRRAARAQLAVQNLSESFQADHPDGFKLNVTSVFSRSHLDWDRAGDKEVTRYDEWTTFLFRFRDFDLLSSLVEQARRIDDVEIGVFWKLTRGQERRLAESLWGQAVVNARQKAEAYAAAADLEITGVKAIADPGLLPDSPDRERSPGSDRGALRYQGAPPEPASSKPHGVDLAPMPIMHCIGAEVHFTAERRL